MMHEVSPLIITPLKGIPDIKEHDTIPEVLIDAVTINGVVLRDDDIFVVAQKIVSKAEGRYRCLKDVVPSAEAIRLAKITEKDPRLINLILDESNKVLRAKPGVIIVEHKLGFVCANAGIDHSNVRKQAEADEVWVLLLPENPDKSAEEIRLAIKQKFGVNVGVLIIDSHGRAWRLGTVGTTIGIAGVPALVDKRGEFDLYGYQLKATIIGVADELAAAASLMMGQAAEGTPVVHVRGFPYRLRESQLDELIRPKELDLFR